MIFKTTGEAAFLVAALTIQSVKWCVIGKEQLLVKPSVTNYERQDLSQLKVCQFREYTLPVEAFPLYTGFNCLNYNDHRVFIGDKNPLAATCTLLVHNLSVVYPCYQRENDSLPFDPTDTEAFQELSAKFKKMTDAERWLRCYKASLQCCDKIVSTYGTEQDPSRCRCLWDGWDCWDAAAEDTFESSYCKEYIYSADAAPSCHYPSKKHCFSREFTNTSHAQWNQTTDYTGCSTKSRLVTKYTFHTAMLGVSIGLSMPAVIIFFCYRRLRIPRIALHRNLLIVIIIRSALVILQIVVLSFNSLQTTDNASVMDQNGVGCRLLSALVQLFSNAVFAMMLMEGIFLHRLIAAVFKSQPNMVYLYSSAAAITILPMIPWTILRVVKYDYSCWATGADALDWINNGTRVALLVINLLLMIDIIRVLLTKLRGVNSWHSDKIKRTARSTLLLLPLFGINTLFVADKPSVIPSCDWEAVFDMVTHAMEGLQGPCVALLYCYCNNEVKMFVKKTVSDRFPKMEALRSRMSSQFARRTFTTNVDDEPAENGEEGRPSTSMNVAELDRSSCKDPISPVAGNIGRRRTTLRIIRETRESAENSIADDEAREPRNDSLLGAQHSGPMYNAWNKFQDKGPADTTQKFTMWNIPPHSDGSYEGCGQATNDSTSSKQSGSNYIQGHHNDSNSNNSSPIISRSSESSREHRNGSNVGSDPRAYRLLDNFNEHCDNINKVDPTFVIPRGSDNIQSYRDGVGNINSALVTNRSSNNVQEHSYDNSDYYSALVSPASSVTVLRDRISNSVVQDDVNGTRC